MVAQRGGANGALRRSCSRTYGRGLHTIRTNGTRSRQCNEASAGSSCAQVRTARTKMTAAPKRYGCGNHRRQSHCERIAWVRDSAQHGLARHGSILIDLAWIGSAHTTTRIGIICSCAGTLVSVNKKTWPSCAFALRICDAYLPCTLLCTLPCTLFCTRALHIGSAHCFALCSAHCSAHLLCTFALHLCSAHRSAHLLCKFALHLALDIRLAHSLCAFALRMTIPIRCSSNMNHNYGVEHSKVFTNNAKRFHESGAQQQALLGAPGHASERASALCLTHSRFTGSERRRRERNHSIARKDRASDRSIARLADVWFTPCAHTSSSRSSHSTSLKI